MKSHQSKKQSGFTLIEIAIVVVIIGLLLGGVLKGQEMIRNARAHNVAAQGAAIKAAVLGFSDRYRALPGDYKKATTNIPGLVTADNGDGNSRIGFDDSGTAGTPGTPGTPEAGNRKLEIVLAWKHLSKSGFISGAFDGDVNDVVEADWICSASCLSNAFNGSLFLVYDDEQTGTTWSAGTARSNQLWTGKGIPVEIIAELDRKVDDGEPSVGSFRVSDGFMDAAALDASDAPLMGDVCAAAATGAVPLPASSADPDGDPYVWTIIDQVTDCGAVYLF